MGRANDPKFIPTLALKVGVLSTGSEIISQRNEEKHGSRPGIGIKQTVPDSNGPYLVSNLRALCPWVMVENLGIVIDDDEELKMALQKFISEDEFDVIITSGDVSKGRHDLDKHVVQAKLKGQIVFHGVKIRPGAPVLFASFDRSNRIESASAQRRAVLFGAPGNPLAAAVALRFFVVPYVFRLSSVSSDTIKEQGISNAARKLDVKVYIPQNVGANKELVGFKYRHPKSEDKTVFWLARRRQGFADRVEPIEDQASYNLRRLLAADCWVIAPAGLSEVAPDDQLIATSLWLHNRWLNRC